MSSSVEQSFSKDTQWQNTCKHTHARHALSRHDYDTYEWRSEWRKSEKPWLSLKRPRDWPFFFNLPFFFWLLQQCAVSGLLLLLSPCFFFFFFFLFLCCCTHHCVSAAVAFKSQPCCLLVSGVCLFCPSLLALFLRFSSPFYLLPSLVSLGSRLSSLVSLAFRHLSIVPRILYPALNALFLIDPL